MIYIYLICYAMLVSDWITHFDDTANELSNQNKDQKITTNENNVHVSKSYFEYVESTILISDNYLDPVKKLLVEDCSFNTCLNTAGEGGAIYFKDGLASVLTNLCGYSCRSQPEHGNSHGQFIYIALSRNSESKNIINFTNAHSTDAHLIEASQAVIFSCNGISTNENLNISSNVCQLDTALRISSGGFEHECRLTYSSIAKNSGQLDCINFDGADCIYIVEKCNIVNNIFNNGRIFYSYSTVTLKDCCLLGNSGNNNLFPENLPATYINCAADFVIDGQNSTEFIVDVLGFKDEYGYCYASYDSVGDLTVNIKNKMSQTCKNFYKRRINSLRIIFI